MLSATPFLDLNKCHSQYRHGDITVCFSWIKPEVTEDFEPAMVFIPTYRMDKSKVKPCIIPLSCVWQYTDPQYLAYTAYQMAKLLGFDDSRHGLKIGELILDYIPELQKIPPREETDKFVAAYATMTDEKGRTHESEIVDFK